jgi:hypothetical protein
VRKVVVMRPPPLLVCERTGRWAAAIRLSFARSGMTDLPRVVETRSPQELRERIVARRREGRPAAPWVAELTPNDAAAVCELLAWHVRAGDDVPATIVTLPEAIEYEATVRTAGANLFLASIRDVNKIVELYTRYLADLPQRTSPTTADDNHSTEPTSLWDRLPWGVAAD